jgi:hypothetical protein
MHRVAGWLSVACMVCVASVQAADGPGLSVASGASPWPRWQGRFAVATEAPSWRSDWGQTSTGGLHLGGLALSGDYYFTRTPLGERGAGGFRATSGVLLGNASAALAAQPIGGGLLNVGRRHTNVPAGLPGAEPVPENNATTPYAGVGYSGLSAKGVWGFSADLGLMAVGSYSTVRLGRSVQGGQSLDDQVRDLRLRPFLQLGVSYSF